MPLNMLKMILRSLNISRGMDEEIGLLAFHLGMNKSDLMRIFLAQGLDNTWNEILKQNPSPVTPDLVQQAKSRIMPPEAKTYLQQMLIR